MADYKKVLDQQLGTLDDTIKRRNKDYIKKEGGGLADKISHIAYTRPEMFKTGVKYTAIGSLGYIAGVILPIVTGPSAAVLSLLGYAGKKYIYDPRFKKKK
ncbi:MAG: hypothetical protein KAI26_04805 [Nanoarchaeota archaeon]|nr:hypothetical protein [Nanoarchaeota archaeon]